MKDYETKIEFASKELTKKESVQLMDTSDCIRLDEETKSGDVIIDPKAYAVLSVHNEHANDNKDYKQYVIIDKDGTKYVTGSESFFRSFSDIMTNLEDSGEEFKIKVFRKPSKNYTGKEFITCSVI